MCAEREFPGVETRENERWVAWPGAQGPHRDGAHHQLRPRPAQPRARRADRRGAHVDPPRRRARRHHHAHARPRLRARRGLLLHRRAAGLGAGGRLPLLRHRVGGRHRVQRGLGRHRWAGTHADPAARHDDVVVRALRLDLARRAGRPARTAHGHDADRARGAGRGPRSRPRRAGPLRPHRGRARRGRVRRLRATGRGARGRRPAQRRRQGGRPPAARRRPTGRRARALRQRPGLVRDRAEGVGGRVLGAGRGERAHLAGGGHRPPGRA